MFGKRTYELSIAGSAASLKGEGPVTLHLHLPQVAQPAPEVDLSPILAALEKVSIDMATLKEAMDRLARESAETASAVDAYKQQTDGIIALLRENAGDPDAVNAIADNLQALQDRLASAVVVNTPATQTGATETPPIADPANAEPTPAEQAAPEGENVVVPENTDTAPQS